MLFITNNSIKHYPYVHAQLNDLTIWFQAILFNRRYLFAHNSNVNHFCLTHRSGLEWTWEQCQWRGNPHTPKFQHYKGITIRLFNIISTTYIGVVLSVSISADSVFYSPSPLCHICKQMYIQILIHMYIWIYIYINVNE